MTKTGRRRDRRKFFEAVRTVRRMLLAMRVFYRRYRFELELQSQDQVPRFRVSWDKLRQLAEHPHWLEGDFAKFMHRLHRLARHDDRESIQAFHALTRRDRSNTP